MTGHTDISLSAVLEGARCSREVVRISGQAMSERRGINHNEAMLLKPFLHLLRDGRLGALLDVGSELKSFYKLTYVAAAGEAGVLERLAAISGQRSAVSGQ